MAASWAEPFALADEEWPSRGVLTAREAVTKRGPLQTTRGAPGEVIVRTTIPIRWLEPVARDLNRMLSLPEGWDSYGANVVRSEAAAAVIKLLARIGNDVKAPSLHPTPAGGILMEWNTPLGGLEIEVEREDRICLLAEESGAGVVIEEEGVGFTRFLIDFLPKVSHLIPRA